MKTSTGILITNIGSPDAPTAKAVRYYLKKFLSDKRIVEIPRIIWYPILYGLILPFRSKASAKLYQKIWRQEGSPLTYYSQCLADALQQRLQLPVVLGTHYGNPSIKDALLSLQEKQIEKIIVLPLYPQYSATTTASTFDHVVDLLQLQRKIPEITFLNDYADQPYYINALCQSIEKTWSERGKPQHLLFSFHGIPETYVKQGDPYLERCQLTAQLVANQLQLHNETWSIAFQSRLGRAKWLTPYTDKILQQLPQKNITHLHVISPGFAVDCLETLEEIAIRGKEQFISAGGKNFYYISALNNTEAHIQTLISIITKMRE